MRRTFYLAALVLLFATSAFAQRKPVYDVYAIRYAITPDYPISDLVYGADPNRKADIAMMIWLVRGGGHNILVDSGFYHATLLERLESQGLCEALGGRGAAWPKAGGHHRHHYLAHALGSCRRHRPVSKGAHLDTKRRAASITPARHGRRSTRLTAFDRAGRDRDGEDEYRGACRTGAW